MMSDLINISNGCYTKLTYDGIVEWVAKHYNPNDYGSLFEFVEAVKSRFEDDKMYFPPSAEGFIRDEFSEYFKEEKSTVLGELEETSEPVEPLEPTKPAEPTIPQDFSKIQEEIQSIQKELDALKQQLAEFKEPTKTSRIGQAFKKLFRL